MRYVSTLDRLSDSVSKVDDEFLLAVINGLSGDEKSLPCRYFYDARGSELFEEITGLPEYYPTRTEAAILSECAPEIARSFANDDSLVEIEPENRDPPRLVAGQRGLCRDRRFRCGACPG